MEITVTEIRATAGGAEAAGFRPDLQWKCRAEFKREPFSGNAHGAWTAVGVYGSDRY